MSKINLKQQRFVAEYLIDGNATAAYMRSGYQATKSSATANAAKLLTNPNIRAEIEKGQRKMLDRLELTAERVLQEVARIAFFDPRKMFDATGIPIPLYMLDTDTACAIAGMEVLEAFDGSGKDRILVGHIKKYKIADKNTALGNALKVLGLLREKVEVTDTTPQVIDPIEGARRLAFVLARADHQLRQVH